MREWFLCRLPECIARRGAVEILLHLAAMSFGGVFCFLAFWDTCIEHHGFNAISFGGGAAPIIGSWGVLVKFKPGAKPEPDSQSGA